MTPLSHHKRGNDVDSAVRQVTRHPLIFFAILNFISPIFIAFFSFFRWNPIYTMFLAIHNFEIYSPIVPISIQISLGIFGTLTVTLMIATIGICILIIGCSIASLYVWTLFLTPEKNNSRNVKLRGGLSFQTAIKMYNTLRVMTLIEN